MTSEQTTEIFWDKLKPGQITTTLMDMLTDTIFYIKNKDGGYIYVNKAFTQTISLPLDNIKEKSDLDLFGHELALSYMQDDAHVIQSGQSIIEKAELVTYRPGIVRWYITNKIPLFDKEDQVIGLAGISRPSQAHKQSTLYGPMSSISKAIEYIYEERNQIITVEKLAAESGLSISTLERYFKKHFSCTPGKFITQVKISNACELLAEPSYSILEIADTLGYLDPVVFSRAFKREMKLTPSEYRKSLSQMPSK